MKQQRRHLRLISRFSAPMRFRIAPGVGVTWCGPQAVLEHRDSPEHSLNRFATRILALLAKGASHGTIVAVLRRELGAPAGWLHAETALVIERLLAAGLIERRGT